MSKKREVKLTVRQAAEYLGVCKQRIIAKIDKGHYPGVHMCDCGLSKLIPLSEVTEDLIKRRGK